MNALKMCLNWKVIAAVALVAVGLFVFAPDLAAAALPLLVLAICPLSMLLMMAVMNGGKNEAGAACSTRKTDPKVRPRAGSEELASLKRQHQELSRRIATLERETPPTTDVFAADASAATR